jgi:hypothetical protein
MVVEMILIIKKIDEKILDFLESFNNGIKEVVLRLCFLALSTSLSWVGLYFLYQIWIYITEGYWKYFTLINIGLESSTGLIGLDKILNYIFELPLLISLIITIIVASFSLFIFLKLIYWTLMPLYEIMRKFISFWFEELK